MGRSNDRDRTKPTRDPTVIASTTPEEILVNFRPRSTASSWQEDQSPHVPDDACTACTTLSGRLAEAQQLLTNALEMVGRAITLQRSVITEHRQQVPGPREPADDAIHTLTPRELQVLRLIAQGLANRQIAKNLGIAEKTVKNHLYAIFAKLDVADRTQAALLAVSTSG